MMSTINPSMASTVNWLSEWERAQFIRPVDRIFALFLAEKSSVIARNEDDTGLSLPVLTAALLSAYTAAGNICLDLADLLDDADSLLLASADHTPALKADFMPSVLYAGCSLSRLASVLLQSGFVAQGQGNSPLVLELASQERGEGAWLYPRRYWAHSQFSATAIEQRLALQPVDSGFMRTLLDKLFAASPTSTDAANQPDWQKIACALAARSGFSVVTGGPGTGKTTTVVRLLALLQAMSLHENGALLDIRLAAPTGKAAARLNLSISAQLDQVTGLLDINESSGIREAILQHGVSTLHRLLGTIPGSRFFRHNRHKHLPADVVVVDEASMVDVEMMSSLLQALAPSTRLVLIGDKDQLASVEAGAVLGQLCRYANEVLYSEDTVRWLQQVSGELVPKQFVARGEASPLQQSITFLRHSYRFGNDSGIGSLSKAVNAGDFTAFMEALACDRFDDVAWLRPDTNGLLTLEQHLLEGLAPCWKMLENRPILARGDSAALPDFDDYARRVLTALNGFQLLCAVRQGDFGVAGVNRLVEQLLRKRGLIKGQSEWYPGRPVMVTANDYSLKLMNGDMGICLPDREGHLRVVFPDSEKAGAVRWILPARLKVDTVETAYAMTVHKSQGSEFGHVCLVLPDSSNPVLSRELLYTGITRASKRFTLVSSGESVISDCISKRTRRSHGPDDILHHPA